MRTTEQKMSAFGTLPEEELCSQDIMQPEGYQQNLKDISKKETKKLQNGMQILLKPWVMLKLSETREENADREETTSFP